MSSHELPPIELKLAMDAESVASGVPVSAKQNLMDLDREGLDANALLSSVQPAPEASQLLRLFADWVMKQQH